MSEAHQPPRPEELAPTTRGGCLATFLVLMIVTNALTAVVYLARPEAIQQETPGISEGMLTLLAVAALTNIGLALMVWSWKRVGVYGFFAVALLAFGVNVLAGIPLHMALVGFGGPILLAFLVRARWHLFS